MQLDSYLLGADLASIGSSSRRLEELGHGCLWSLDAQHDPFLPLVAAAAATSTVRLGTNIAVAFARNPMTVAQTARDLHALSGGRFVLGLGPQVRGHIERRYSMPWSRPVERMREFVCALQAIWAAWEEGRPLRFEGEYYRHTLMAPNFDPGPTGFGAPPVFLAGVGPKMVATAGGVADGLLCHPLTTAAYLEAVTLPALAAAGRQGQPFEVVVSVLAATGPDDASVEASIGNVRRKIAFYASTPAYRALLDVHGLGHLQPELNDLARAGRWDEMTAVVDDRTLEAFAVVGSPAEIGRELRRRFTGLADRVTVYELDGLGRLRLDRRHLAEPGPAQELFAGFRSSS